MFTGIIEAKSKVLHAHQGEQAIRIQLARPAHFQDLKIGDSIACNGVCLTLEEFDSSALSFTIGYETLKVTGWSLDQIRDTTFNLERSLRFGDRIHGHMVSGHVDSVSRVVKKEHAGDCLIFVFELPVERSKEIWPKSSVALNGVSLTVNEIGQEGFQVCLIPETLRQTQLSDLQVGDTVNLETDYYMKGLLQAKGEAHA